MMIPAKGKMTRRDMMQLSSGLVILPALSACGDTSAPGAVSNYREIIADVSELIIPHTDTPGAKVAGVPQFIEMLLEDWYAPDERDAFIQTLAQFDTVARDHGHTNFLEADLAAKIALLEGMEQGPVGKTAFDEMKQLTVWGYYTSEAATEELNYDPIPGRLDGCADLTEVGRAYLITGI